MADPSWSDPGFAFFALGRAGYGPRPGEAAEVARRGFASWVEEQLAPHDDADMACTERLRAARLHIRYNANEKWPALDETRPLTTLAQPIEAVWPLITRRAEMDGAERRRPRDEVIAATLLRAVHSRWQLREVMRSFWHDHFNVDAFGSEQVAVALPSYDRDVIGRHAFGNFRQLLEAVATSAAMLYYLSNRASRAGAANENYGRELFELHTLGRAAYLNDRYDRWRDVPGALKGAPAGYIDQDVYEAARAFTGWTVEDGTGLDGQRKLPETGRFAYVETWHDGYQKRVLASEFQPFAAPLADGRKVLDLVADHPATARHLAQKLCARLVDDNPPERLVAAASERWTAARRAPDQIAQVLRLILLSPEFAASRGRKTRRPLALAAAFARATSIDLAASDGLAGELANAGQRLFGWPTPTGLPDEQGYFLGANAMRHRWAIVLGLTENWWQTGALEPARTGLRGAVTSRGAARHWATLLHGSADPATIDAVLGGLGWPPDDELGAIGGAETDKRAARIAALCAMAPSFQVT
jgi:uncharacterized protein (DUF1800 family)